MKREYAVVVTIALLVLLKAPFVSSQDDHVWSVIGVAGTSSDLPCYLNPRTPGDRPKLILWYKRGTRTPVFSHDGRVPQMRADIQQEGGRLAVGRNAATLTLESLRVEHAGVYECRVDFFKSPTHTNFVNLTVVEPPGSVQIFDSEGGQAKDGIIGPYREGMSITLTCRAIGGSPSPNVTWWREDKLLSGSWERKGEGLVQNELKLNKLSREWHNESLTCIAANTHLASPFTVTILIQMFLLPTSVIISNPGSVREGEQVRLVCTSSGSRPSASLTWVIRGVTRTAEKENLMYAGVTSSTLIANLTREDDGTEVTCRANNPAAPDYLVTNTTRLTVHYPPTVSASLGRSLRPELLKQGDDVYFTCTVAANPPASSIVWYHEDKVQVQNLSIGVILSGNSLVLQKVDRTRAGRYRCSAANKLAEVTSPPVNLRIRYEPVCQTSPTTYFIYDKPINVTCTVASYPAVRAIQWQWNSSTDVISTMPISEEDERVSAQLTVEPIKSKEDRTLTCWAVNEMGKQSRPCGFSVKVAQMPMPLSSCRLANITASSLSLTCQKPTVASAGTTLYRAEVYFQNNTLFANVTSPRPNFNVSRLDAGMRYEIKVYVTHGPVTSQPVVVSAYTSRTSRTTSGSSTTSGRSVGEVLGIIAVVTLLLGFAIWGKHYCKNRAKKKKEEPRVPSDESNPDVVPTTVEESVDLLEAGTAKSELPLLSPIYDSLGAPLSESIPVTSISTGEVYPSMRLPHPSSESDAYKSVRADLHCPVDQLMQAAETIV
ncbi:B-cell receptor CD22-like [Palaemon carinicauda]|uniref:B-cell receptor CD22-like n=1 Tax=Palaemon carinicauda TaxID=392227 RepID=UPI0035B5A61F